MKYEEAEVRALAMIAALGKSWVMDIADNHGYIARVKNGPCTVSFNENSRTYEGHVRLGSMFTGYGSNPLSAFETAVGRMSTHFNRTLAEYHAIFEIVGATPAKVKP